MAERSLPSGTPAATSAISGSRSACRATNANSLRASGSSINSALLDGMGVLLEFESPTTRHAKDKPNAWLLAGYDKRGGRADSAPTPDSILEDRSGRNN